MRAREFITESIDADQVLDYVKRTHAPDEFNIEYSITDHPEWELKTIPLRQLHLDPDGESQDPYNRVNWVDDDKVQELIPRIGSVLKSNPIVVDSQGWIIDGNHRAAAAVEAGLDKIPAYVPVKSTVAEGRGVKQQIEEFLDSLSPDDVGVEEFPGYRIHFEGFTDECKSSSDYQRNPNKVYKQVYQDFIDREGGKKPAKSGMIGDEEYPILYSVFKVPQSKTIDTAEKAYNIAYKKKQPWPRGSREEKLIRSNWQLSGLYDQYVLKQDMAEDSENYNGLQFSIVKDSRYLRVNAFAPGPGRAIAQVDFKIDNKNELHPEDLHVEERYRGQGIAATMYDYVKSKGYNIHRSWSQTDDGAGFWDRHRGEERVWEQGVAEGTLNEYRDALYNFVKSKFPTWPEYVLKDFLYAQAKGIRDKEELKDFLDRNQKDFGQVKWRLEKLPIRLDIFTPKTQRMIKQREGGSSNPFQVPRDADRHAQQLKMIQQQGVRTEPIIVAKLNNGYDLIEGWHRTIQHLQQYPEGYTGPAWVAYGATYTSDDKPGVPVKQNMAENMDHSQDGGAVAELKAALLAKRDRLQSASDDQVYDIIDRIMTRIARSHSISGQKLHDMWVDRYKQIPDTWIMNENFADGKGPGRPGDSQRHGIPKKATMAELEKAAHAKGRKGQLARWQLNMRRGRKK